LKQVEKSLDFQLPTHYRQFLLDHGAAVARARRRGVFVPFFTAAKEIIDANKEMRANPSLRETNQDTEPWPLKYLIVGTDGGGDDWCVDLTDEREVIWLFDSEAYGIFRPATPATWAEYLAELRAPKAPEPRPLRFFLCKKGTPAPDAEGDGLFTLRDGKGRDWLCYEQHDPTPEEFLARVRGEYRAPAWLGEKGVRNLGAADLDELCEGLSNER
jgi:hypothetical protein